MPSFKRIMRCVLLSCLFLSVPTTAMEPALQTIAFQPSSADFINPERGFFHFRDLTNTFGYDQIRNQGHSLIYGRILAEDFRNAPLSPSFLNDIQAGFDAARTNGIKVKPRVAYNNDGGADAPKSVILNHIQQLKPLWEANKDVIFHMDAGFIGGWGEWHSSTNGLDNNADRTEILSAILAALPEDRMVGIRTPHFKRHIFNGSPVSDAIKITADNAFDGSDLSRVGHLNDCFLASATDFGTYIYQAAGWTRQAEIDYLGGESRFAPHGGETCTPSSFSQSTNAISEMEQLHTDYLNIDYHPDVIQSWVNDGKFDEISRRLGYRFELQVAKLPDAVKPSGLLEIEFEIDNVGFGELFNPRNVEVTLKNNATGEIIPAALQVDPRFWSGGSSNQVHAYLSIPAEMDEATYTVGLRMRDFETTLQDDIRYSLQFANTGVWDSQTGINILKNDLVISTTADGSSYVGMDGFEEVLDPTQLSLFGDFNSDAKVDGADYTVWRDNLGTDFDLNGNGDETGGSAGVVDQKDYELWQANFGNTGFSSALAVPEPNGMSWWVFVMLVPSAWRTRGAKFNGVEQPERPELQRRGVELR